MKAKNTFSTLIFIFSLMLITATANSQGTTRTPMGQTVYLENDWDTPYLIANAEAWAAQWIKDNNSDAKRIAPATSNYNCHSYAWNVTESGPSTDSWMNQTVNGNPNLSKYWTNDGYISTSTVSDHEKIFYSSGDHSAVTTSTSGKVRSKWGQCGLYEHSTAQCPYSSGNLLYYKLVNPTISGTAEVLCNNSQRTFSESSFTNISLNYDWSTSSPLSEVSGDGTSSYTVAGTSQSGSGVINLTITTPSGATATASKYVWVGITASFTGNTSVQYGGSGTWTASASGCTPPYHYEWFLHEQGAGEGVMVATGNQLILWSVPRSMELASSESLSSEVVNQPITFTNYYLNLRAYDANGMMFSTPEKLVVAYGDVDLINPMARMAGGEGENTSTLQMKISPNPAKDEATVEISNIEAQVLNESAEWQVEVYDAMQALKTNIQKIKGSKQTIRTTGWKEGVYIVRAKVGNEILTDKLMIKP